MHEALVQGFAKTCLILLPHVLEALNNVRSGPSQNFIASRKTKAFIKPRQSLAGSIEVSSRTRMWVFQGWSCSGKQALHGLERATCMWLQNAIQRLFERFVVRFYEHD
ncbi:MAG: hypothetical protein ACLPID_21410 [Beijerinckiaceae bacterium]